ncbi:hypothetical protein [Woeseia oceani]|uniref:Uncharacterized protein n=1 Tax=Woeseia oceani TaxID=1548547 RepID=A0A193LHP4_9GAMM|nr:hypothetical protein [Woeseia oceani]ANO52032.1 hypothetical protein BA177_13225 [Woeseia oceani]
MKLSQTRNNSGSALFLSVLLITSVLLSACSKPVFTFRGYAADATCSAIVRAEQQAGAEVVGQRQQDMETLGMLNVTELRGSVFDLPMFIEVACDESDVALGVWYLAAVNNQNEQAAAYERLSSNLEAQFGAPVQSGDAGSRSSRFHCDEHGLVSLYEGEDEHMEEGGEVSVFVDLRPDLC